VTIIADAFSRIVLLPAGEKEALTLPEIVFSPVLGKKVASIKAGKSSVPVLWYYSSGKKTFLVQPGTPIQTELANSEA